MSDRPAADDRQLLEDEQPPERVRPEFDVTPFVECPNCRRLLEYGLERCPDCFEEIEEDYSFVSVAVVSHNTQACSFAKAVESFDPFTVFLIPISVYAYLCDYHIAEPYLQIFPLAVLSTFMPLAAVVLWFYRFGSFAVGDDDYDAAKRQVLKSLKLWLTVLAVQIVALATLWF